MNERQRRRVEVLEQQTGPPDNPLPGSIVLAGVERDENGELVEVCRGPELPVGKPKAEA